MDGDVYKYHLEYLFLCLSISIDLHIYQCVYHYIDRVGARGAREVNLESIKREREREMDGWEDGYIHRTYMNIQTYICTYAYIYIYTAVNV